MGRSLVTTPERITMSKIPEAALIAADPFIAGINYPDYETDRDLTERLLEVAAPAIRVDYLRTCVDQFLDAAGQTDIPEALTESIANVFRAFADAEEERGKRVAQAHGREV